MELVQSQFRVSGNVSIQKTLQRHLNFHSGIDYEVQIKLFPLTFVHVHVNHIPMKLKRESAAVLDTTFNMEMIRSAFVLVF